MLGYTYLYPSLPLSLLPLLQMMMMNLILILPQWWWQRRWQKRRRGIWYTWQRRQRWCRISGRGETNHNGGRRHKGRDELTDHIRQGRQRRQWRRRWSHWPHDRLMTMAMARKGYVEGPEKGSWIYGGDIYRQVQYLIFQGRGGGVGWDGYDNNNGEVREDNKYHNDLDDSDPYYNPIRHAIYLRPSSNMISREYKRLWPAGDMTPVIE